MVLDTLSPMFIKNELLHTSKIQTFVENQRSQPCMCVRVCYQSSWLVITLRSNVMFCAYVFTFTASRSTRKTHFGRQSSKMKTAKEVTPQYKGALVCNGGVACDDIDNVTTRRYQVLQAQADRRHTDN